MLGYGPHHHGRNEEAKHMVTLVFFNDASTAEIYTRALRDALPISALTHTHTHTYTHTHTHTYTHTHTHTHTHTREHTHTQTHPYKNIHTNTM